METIRQLRNHVVEHLRRTTKAMQQQQGRLSRFASFAVEDLNAFDGNPAIADQIVKILCWRCN